MKDENLVRKEFNEVYKDFKQHNEFKKIMLEIYKLKANIF